MTNRLPPQDLAGTNRQGPQDLGLARAGQPQPKPPQRRPQLVQPAAGPDESAQRLADVRHALGLSVSQMATAIGLDGDNAADRVREMERGARPISGPLRLLLGYMAQSAGAEPHAPDARLAARVLPRWLDCTDMQRPPGASASGPQVLMHNRWPRFWGLLFERLPPQQLQALRSAGACVVTLPPALGAGLLVCVFIDAPAGDVTALVEQAIAVKLGHVGAGKA